MAYNISMCKALTRKGVLCKKSGDLCFIHARIYEKKGANLYDFHQLLYKQYNEKTSFINNILESLFRNFGTSWIREKEYVDGYGQALLYICTKHVAEKNVFLQGRNMVDVLEI